jgi:hypothetical protein
LGQCRRMKTPAEWDGDTALEIAAGIIRKAFQPYLGLEPLRQEDVPYYRKIAEDRLKHSQIRVVDVCIDPCNGSRLSFSLDWK